MHVSILTKYAFYCLSLSCTIHMVTAFECYVCTRQEDNKGKCIQTVKTCSTGQDRCLSIVKWGSTPYWDATGEKQYYIWKQCATKDYCEEYISNVTKFCDRIWYNDWECAECCAGDRCNYYVTLGSNLTLPSNGLVLLLAALGLFMFNSW